jgi:hypothetical protein
MEAKCSSEIKANRLKVNVLNCRYYSVSIVTRIGTG